MNFSAIQDLYPGPPIRRYHRIEPREEQQIDIQRTITVEKEINWLYVGIAFIAGYLLGRR